jgi:carboxyl-terminal processing protease
MYGAIKGLVDSLNDPYTVFFDPKSATDFQQEISGKFSGIGAEIGMNKDNQVVIIAPLKGTPAEKAGLMPQDAILKINGTSTAGMNVDQAANTIRGPQETTVTLTIMRAGWKTSKDFSIVRDTIQIPTIEFKMVDTNGTADAHGTIAYIKLDNFYEQAPQLFYDAAQQALERHAQAIIVDLRNNPGGYLDGATAIANLFVKPGEPIVTEAFRDPSRNQTYTSRGPSILSDLPIAVLINGGSASAAEILAGALKDDRNALIMGQKSFGKGTVQQLFPLTLGDQSGLIKMTIAHWITPAGHMIDKQGIEPTVTLQTPSDQAYLDNPDAADQQWVTAAAKALAQQINK